jgi:hypothetical protein
MPMMNPIALATVNTRLEKRLSGSTGSGARRSTGISSAVAMTAITPRPTICHEPHAYVWPPRLVASTNDPAPRLRRIVPRTSICASRRSCGTRRAAPMTASATMPIGMLT